MSVTYESTNEEVATVDENGLVEAVGVGETTVTVTVDGVTDTANINVEEPESGED